MTLITEKDVEQYRTLDREVDKALDALEVPTWYARTNEMEDFAETFVAFMDAPEKLSKTAKYRMQRALYLSN